jgi:hypothetical protein
MLVRVSLGLRGVGGSVVAVWRLVRRARATSRRPAPHSHSYGGHEGDRVVGVRAAVVALSLAVVPATGAQAGLEPAEPAVPPSPDQAVDRALVRDGVPQVKLTASDGAGADFAAVGGNSGQGAGYVFGCDGQEWSERAKLVAADGAPFDGFSGNAVAIDGDAALVGAQGATVDDNDVHGSAYLFSLDAGAVTLTASDGAADDWFGRAVAIDGNTALVGADATDVAGVSNRGRG